MEAALNVPERALTISDFYIWHFIAAYQDEHGAPPTIREIQDEMGFATTSTVAFHLDKLTEHGKIAREYSAARGIRLLSRPRYDVAFTASGRQILLAHAKSYAEAWDVLNAKLAEFANPEHVFFQRGHCITVRRAAVGIIAILTVIPV